MASLNGESDDDNDTVLDEDLEALRRACILTGANPADALTSSGAAATSGAGAASGAASDSDSDSVDDLELLRNIQKRLSTSSGGVSASISLKPLSFLPPVVSDDEEGDFEILRAVQKRFSAYHDDSLRSAVDTNPQKTEKVLDSGQGRMNSEDVSNSTLDLESFSRRILENESSRLDASNIPTSHSKQTSFPKLGHMFVDAIKKNRSYQRFLRSKMIELEARLEENKKLKERVKILKDFQVSCRRRTGRALTQKKDARVQLISLPKLKASKNPKVNDKKVSAICFGPSENPHVANYRMALKEFPLSFGRAKWSKLESQNLGNGIKQQFQEMLLQKSVDMFSGPERYFEDPNDFDDIMGSITNLEIRPENIRLFLPKVNWERLASMYVTSRSAAECEARWLNCDDPLINHDSWTVVEDKNLLFIVQQRGLNNWIDIAVSLGTNRTPFQCLARYQRSLNACIMKREWTVDEDAQLRTAVEEFGEGNWQLIASVLQGRTGTQCSNRWKQTLHPARHRVGRWTTDEDKRLKVAVTLFGPKTWRKVAEFVPGRTQVQCRERWVNSLDPSLNWGQWTGEEDAKLEAAIREHGHYWSKVAACVPPRTDSQCRRRWKVLFPHEVPLLQAARKIQKVALVSNFVDRESERPALGPNDFLPLPEVDSVSKPRKVSKKRKIKSREQPETEGGNNSASWNVQEGAETSSKKVPGNSNANKVGIVAVDNVNSKKRKKMRKSCLRKAKNTEPVQDYPSCEFDSTMQESHTNEVGIVIEDNANTKKKKRVRKPCSRKAKNTEPAQDYPSCDLDSAVRESHAKEVGMVVEDNVNSEKRRRVRKPCLRKAKNTEPAQGYPSCDLDSAMRESHVNEVGIVVENNVNSENRKRVRKPCLRKAKNTEPVQNYPSRELDSTMRGSHANEVAIVPEEIVNSKRKRMRKAKNTKPVQDYPSCDLDSAKLMRTDGEEVGEFAMQAQPSSDLNSAMLMRTDGEEMSKFASQGRPSDLDSAMLLITNGGEVGEFGRHDIIEKGDSLTPRSKRGSITSHENLNLQIVDADGVETISGDDTAACRKKRAPKRHPRKHKCAEQSGEHQVSTLKGNGVMSEETRMAPKQCPKENMCADESVEIQASLSLLDLIFDGNDATSNMKKIIPKLHRRRRINNEQSKQRQVSSPCLESISSGQADSTSGGDILTEERAEQQMQVCLEPKENEIVPTSLHGHSRGAVCHEDRPKRKRSKNKPNHEQSSRAANVDPITPGLSLHDSDDLPLACYINRCFPNRKLKSAARK